MVRAGFSEGEKLELKKPKEQKTNKQKKPNYHK